MDAVKTQQDDCAGLMARIGKPARLPAAELAFASAERKYAALIGVAEAVWNARDELSRQMPLIWPSRVKKAFRLPCLTV
jgi:hypothetical protein